MVDYTLFYVVILTGCIIPIPFILICMIGTITYKLDKIEETNRTGIEALYQEIRKTRLYMLDN
jgi:hypothetical protein